MEHKKVAVSSSLLVGKFKDKESFDLGSLECLDVEIIWMIFHFVGPRDLLISLTVTSLI